LKLDTTSYKFGGAQKFPVRFAWLPKGVKEYSADTKIFEDPEATVKLGVGSAMVKSIKYWLQAFQLVDKKNGKLTDLCVDVFDPDHGHDPFLEDDGTLWMLHWLLASNAKDASAAFWFFNLYHQPEFSADEASTSLRDFVSQNLQRPVSVSTLDADVSVLLRMYAQSKLDPRNPMEDSLDSPFAGLSLVSKSITGKRYSSRYAERLNLPNLILGYAVISVMLARKAQILPIEDLMYSKDQYAAPGTIFRLTENTLITKLEEMSLELSDYFEVRESNGINQIFLKEALDPYALIAAYYSGSSVEKAA
jgi:hypothetical protein